MISNVLKVGLNDTNVAMDGLNRSNVCNGVCACHRAAGFVLGSLICVSVC